MNLGCSRSRRTLLLFETDGENPSSSVWFGEEPAIAERFQILTFLVLQCRPGSGALSVKSNSSLDAQEYVTYSILSSVCRAGTGFTL